MYKVARFRFSHFVAAAIFLAGLPVIAVGQDTAAKQPYNKVIGAVTTVAPDGSKITVKPDSGDAVDVSLDSNTSYMQVPPGEKDLKKATRIDFKDIKPGDRVYARSRKVDGQEHTPAVSVIVMSQTAVAQQQEKTRAEWQRRGAAGKVTAVDPAAKTVTIAVQTAAGPKNLTVQTDSKTTFRRYSPDSVRFADAQPSDFATIAVGNNVRILGDKNADGTSIQAEEVVSGSFRNLSATVISVDAANNQIKVNDLLTKKPVTINVNSDSNLRKLPQPMAQQMAMMLARARAGGAANSAAGYTRPTSGTGAPATPGQPHEQGGPDSHPGFNGPATSPAGSPLAGTSQWASGNPGGSGSPGRMDMNQMLERAPQITLADLKPGDALIVSGTNGADPSRATAITLVAGVEPLLAAAPQSSGSSAGPGSSAWTLDIGLPQ